MVVQDEIEFLILLRDKVDLTISKVSIKEPLIEISVMIDSRLEQLKKELV